MTVSQKFCLTAGSFIAGIKKCWVFVLRYYDSYCRESSVDYLWLLTLFCSSRDDTRQVLKHLTATSTGVRRLTFDLSADVTYCWHRECVSQTGRQQQLQGCVVLLGFFSLSLIFSSVDVKACLNKQLYLLYYKLLEHISLYQLFRIYHYFHLYVSDVFLWTL